MWMLALIDTQRSRRKREDEPLLFGRLQAEASNAIGRACDGIGVESSEVVTWLLFHYRDLDYCNADFLQGSRKPHTYRHEEGDEAEEDEEEDEEEGEEEEEEDDCSGNDEQIMTVLARSIGRRISPMLG